MWSRAPIHRFEKAVGQTQRIQQSGHRFAPLVRASQIDHNDIKLFHVKSRNKGFVP
jgi:hypothetical protein